MRAILFACVFQSVVFSTATSVLADDIDDTFHQMNVENSLDRQAGAMESQALSQQDQADSQRRIADAMEKLVNGGLTNDQIRQQQEDLRIQSERDARVAKAEAPIVIQRYQATVNLYITSRFNEWYKIQPIDAVAKLLNIYRRTNYIDPLTRKRLEIEAEDDYENRLKAAARDYFVERYIRGDALYISWQHNILDMKSDAAQQKMPSEPKVYLPDGINPKDGAAWVAWQWYYPGVDIPYLWKKSIEQAKSENQSATPEQISTAAMKTFKHKALEAIYLGDAKRMEAVFASLMNDKSRP